MRAATALLGVLLSAIGCVEVDTDTGEGSAAVLAGAGGVPRESIWAYWDRGGDLGSAWRAGGFDDAAWAVGHGPLGYGEPYVEQVSYGPSSTSKYITTYFRTHFTVADAAAVVGMTGELMYDDGVVVYLNGVEIARASMPGGAITAATLAAPHEAEQRYLPFDGSAFVGALVTGTNTLAVEVHQAAASSSDLVFDLSLSLRTAPAAGIAPRSTWSYWDRGSDLGTVWRERSYDSSGWARGAAPLGYGETYLATTIGYGPSATQKYITSYFRHDFTVGDPSSVTSMIGRLMFDDGAVVYLNGTRLVAASMPAGTPTASTLAIGHEAGNTYVAYDWTAQKGLLVAGVNTVAVEVHQADPASSDLVFDLALELGAATPPPPPPPLEYRIDRRATWSVWDRGGDLGTAWRAAAFDDSAWTRGAGPLGYGEGYLATTLSYGPDPNNKYVTTYFRKKFLVESQPYIIYAIRGELMYDDGFVVYLNGHEIARQSMPGGTITASTLAASHEASNAYQSWDWTPAMQWVVPGENVLAVEVHQQAPSSSDLVFDLALDLRVIPLFTKYAGNPVVAGTQTPGDPPWDGSRRDPAVVHLPDGSWAMYMTDGGPIQDFAIYRGVSADGVHWTVDAAAVWAGEEPTVLFDGSTWRMWYVVDHGDAGNAIHLATSSDGVHWTEATTSPVLGQTGPWERDVFNPTVIEDGPLYKMWYEGLSTSANIYQVGYATSPDGVTWTRRATPVLLQTTRDPHVIFDRGEYKMWYVSESDVRTLEYATSRDGVDWTRWIERPVLTSHDGDWDGFPAAPCVLRDGDVLRMWYSGSDTNGLHQIGYATH